MASESNVALINNFLVWCMCILAACVLFLRASHCCICFCCCMSVIAACMLLWHVSYCMLHARCCICVIAACTLLLLHVCYYCICSSQHCYIYFIAAWVLAMACGIAAHVLLLHVCCCCMCVCVLAAAGGVVVCVPLLHAC